MLQYRWWWKWSDGREHLDGMGGNIWYKVRLLLRNNLAKTAELNFGVYRADTLHTTFEVHTELHHSTHKRVIQQNLMHLKEAESEGAGWINLVQYSWSVTGTCEHDKEFPSSSSSYRHEVRPINDLFRPHDCISLHIDIQGVVWSI
jgi:hypothetical protein